MSYFSYYIRYSYIRKEENEFNNLILIKMKIVRVQYTAKQEYVEQNKENISRVMDELRKLNNPGIKYSVFMLNDGKSFMHFAMFDSEENQKIHNNLDSFKRFTSELRANGLETQPISESLSLVDSSFDIFGN